MIRRALIAVVATGALTAGGVAVLAPSPADAATQAVDAADKGRLSSDQRAQLKSSGHITFTRTTKKGKTVTVLVQRGAITALSATSVTLKSPDGYTHTYVIDRKTRERGRGDAAVGERARVIAVQDEKGDEARRLRHGFRKS